MGLAVGVLGSFIHYDDFEDFALWELMDGWNGVVCFFVYVFCNYLFSEAF
jgi:hypothetical protein